MSSGVGHDSSQFEGLLRAHSPHSQASTVSDEELWQPNAAGRRSHQTSESHGSALSLRSNRRNRLSQTDGLGAESFNQAPVRIRSTVAIEDACCGTRQLESQADHEPVTMSAPSAEPDHRQLESQADDEPVTMSAAPSAEPDHRQLESHADDEPVTMSAAPSAEPDHRQLESQADHEQVANGIVMASCMANCEQTVCGHSQLASRSASFSGAPTSEEQPARQDSVRKRLTRRLEGFFSLFSCIGAQAADSASSTEVNNLASSKVTVGSSGYGTLSRPNSRLSMTSLSPPENFRRSRTTLANNKSASIKLESQV